MSFNDNKEKEKSNRQLKVIGDISHVTQYQSVLVGLY